jgi:hypothetical protein
LSGRKARQSLADAVRATKRDGYKFSNPITQANASFKMRESADPKDQLIAQLDERVAALETSLRKANPTGPAVTRRTNELKRLFFEALKAQTSQNEIETIIAHRAQALGIDASVISIDGQPLLALENHTVDKQPFHIVPEGLQTFERLPPR